MSLKDLLIPPLEGAAQRLAAWRVSIAGAVIGAWLVIFYMLATYATASELGSVRDAMTEVQAMLIAQRIDRAQAALCTRPGDLELLDFLHELNAKHHQVTGRQHKSPDCSLLLRVSQ